MFCAALVLCDRLMIPSNVFSPPRSMTRVWVGSDDSLMERSAALQKKTATQPLLIYGQKKMKILTWLAMKTQQRG
jgi:hypothetical protein